MKILMHTVSLSDLLEDADNLNPVLATDSWQTLMTFTRESARECISCVSIILHITHIFPSKLRCQLRLLQAGGRAEWTMISHRRCLIRLQRRRLRAQARAAGRQELGYARIARLRTRMGGRTVKCVGCRYDCVFMIDKTRHGIAKL